MAYCYTTSLAEEALPQEIAGSHIYPNPANNMLHIKGIDKEGYVLLYNLQGQLCANQRVSPSSANLDISQLPEGLYFIRIVQQHGVLSEVVRVLR